MTTTLPYWAASLVQQVEVHQHAEARHERGLREIATREWQRRDQFAHRVTSKREAVARFTDVAYAFAATVLACPADYPAHALDFAVGLLNETVDYTRAEMKGRRYCRNPFHSTDLCETFSPEGNSRPASAVSRFESGSHH
jgi:hypothetical protein